MEEVVVAPEEIIDLNIFNEDGEPLTEVLGDGHSIINLVATIPSDADNQFRTVTFSKSGGEFVGLSTDTSVQTVDNDGIAKASLKVPFQDGPLFISAQIGSGNTLYKDEEMINLLDVDEVLSFEILNGESDPISEPIRADGATILVLKATINLNQQIFDRLKFRKSSGIFLGVNEDEAIREINENNTATINYRVSNIVQRIFFSVEAETNASVFKELDFDLERAYADSIIIEPQTLTMDSTSTNNITVHLLREVGAVSLETLAFFEAFQLNGDNTEVPIGRFTGLNNAVTNSDGSITGVVFLTDTGDIDFTKSITIRVTTRNDIEEFIVETIVINP